MNEGYSLTFPQQNIWLEDRLYGNSKVNLSTGIININKGLNIEYCKKAINNIIKRLFIEKILMKILIFSFFNNFSILYILNLYFSFLIF